MQKKKETTGAQKIYRSFIKKLRTQNTECALADLKFKTVGLQSQNQN